MRGDKELQNVHAFTQVGLDRDLYGPSRGVGHVAAHTCQLFDLVDTASGPRLRHHVDRIVRIKVLLQSFRNIIGRSAPGIDHSTVTAIII